jgi:hypothetical protein
VGDDLVVSMGGSDTVYEGCAWDCGTSIFGGRGADRLNGQEGDMSTLEGGRGTDTLITLDTCLAPPTTTRWS